MANYPELTDIYRKHFSKCSKTLSQIVCSGADVPTNPLLISPPSGYYTSDFKIMYFGQEANGWDGMFRESKGVDHLLDVYDRFANNGGGFHYSGQFWNAVKQFNRRFSQLHASTSFIYNNIIKIGKHQAFSHAAAPPAACPARAHRSQSAFPRARVPA